MSFGVAYNNFVVPVSEHLEPLLDFNREKKDSETVLMVDYSNSMKIADIDDKKLPAITPHVLIDRMKPSQVTKFFSNIKVKCTPPAGLDRIIRTVATQVLRMAPDNWSKLVKERDDSNRYHNEMYWYGSKEPDHLVEKWKEYLEKDQEIHGRNLYGDIADGKNDGDDGPKSTKTNFGMHIIPNTDGFAKLGVILIKLIKLADVFNFPITIVHIYCMMCININLCDYVLKSADASGLIQEIIDKDPEVKTVVQYHFEYAIRILKLEENISRRVTMDTHRNIFTIDQASKLPFFDAKACNSPYLTTIAGKDIETRCPLLLNKERRILPRVEFDRRFNMLTNDLITKEVIDTVRGRVAMSGGVILACNHESPLEENFKTDDEKSGNDFQKYFDVHYKSWNTFLPDGKWDAEVAKENFSKVSDLDFGLMLPCTDDKAKDDETLEAKVYEIVEVLKEAVKGKKPLFDTGDENVEPFTVINVPSANNYPHWYVYSPYMNVTIEFFRCKVCEGNVNPQKSTLINRFHGGWVRSWFDGDQVYMMMNAITSIKTGVSEVFHYKNNSQVPIEIIFKYNSRGFTLLMNKKMKLQFFEYIALIHPQFNIPKKDYDKNITKDHLVVRPMMPGHPFNHGPTDADQANFVSLKAVENYSLRDLTFKGMQLNTYKTPFLCAPDPDVLTKLS